MAETEITEAARAALRITSTAFDGEIETLIEAAKIAMVNSGVLPELAADESNAAVRLAILVFVKANFGLDNPEADRLQSSFDSMVTQLKMTQSYGQVLSE